MAPKLEIATTTHSTSELAPILAKFSSRKLASSKQLFGGYSGSNYRVDLMDEEEEAGCDGNGNGGDGATSSSSLLSSPLCLKITNGYTAEHAELMCRTAHLLGANGFGECCLPISKMREAEEDTTNANSSDKDNDNDNESSASQVSFQFVSLKDKDRVPAFLLTFVRGTQADKVMREKPHLAANVMRSIGGALARMHQAVHITGQQHAQHELGVRWYGEQTHGGCCDVQDQVNGTVLATMEACPHVHGHAFLPFYKHELAFLQSEMKLANKNEIPLGITHGDPFADNILVDYETGNVVAFIDIEDVCAGPLLFDLTCCVIGCCFDDEAPHGMLASLNMRLLEALLEGYCGSRKLTPVECDHFVPFMKLTLLCNCCWRFVQFNVKSSPNDDVPEEARNSYLELQRRIEYLGDPKIVQEINAILKKLQ